MGRGICSACALTALLAAACASGKSGGGDEDASVGPADAGTDAIVADAAPDAAPPVGTCEACTANADCEDDHLCALIGGDRACLPRCTTDDPTCPDGFACGGVETTFCAPSDGLCCIDGDDDKYGTGIQCDGADCDDTNGDIHPGADDICNGADDDCDPITADGVDDPLLGADCDGDDVDLCDEGVFFCESGDLVCDDATGDNLDLCNGMDDDCDPSTLDGSADPAFGMACDSTGDPDLCFDDQNVCDSVGGMIVCQDLAGGALDLCNGLDDDCNPATADGDGDPLVGVSCDGDDVDLCKEGTTYCSGGAVLCDDPNDVDPDICNGIDDDCDPSTLDGSGDPDVGLTCDGSDSDFCEEGFTVCNVGVKICTDTTGNDTEICNGFDDDCDTIVDDLVPDVICPTQHPSASNVSSWACSGSCMITGCTAGFGDIDGSVGNGCECGPLDSYSNTCGGVGAGDSIGLGDVVDMIGYIEAAGDSDYYRVNFDTRPIPQSWTPRIELTSASVMAGFHMDVLKTSCGFAQCDTNRNPSAFEENGDDVTTWEASYLAASYGTGAYDKTAKQTSVVIRVYRPGGPVCTTYRVRITNP